MAEVDASVTPLMPAAQLYTAGMSYSFNTHRVPFNRVTGVWLTGEKRPLCRNNTPRQRYGKTIWRMTGSTGWSPGCTPPRCWIR